MNQPTTPEQFQVLPTRIVKDVTPMGFVLQEQREYASLQSVTITNTLKDGPRVSEVKCYGQSGQEAAAQAIATYLYAETKLWEARVQLNIELAIREGRIAPQPPKEDKLRDALTANQPPIGGHTTKHPAQDGAA